MRLMRYAVVAVVAIQFSVEITIERATVRDAVCCGVLSIPDVSLHHTKKSDADCIHARRGRTRAEPRTTVRKRCVSCRRRSFGRCRGDDGVRERPMLPRNTVTK
jgi:hypothetical protein